MYRIENLHSIITHLCQTFLGATGSAISVKMFESDATSHIQEALPNLIPSISRMS